MKKKYAMLIMNPLFNSETDCARIDTEVMENHILTVRNPEEALALCARLKAEGFGAVEVCGAFGEELARQMYEAMGKTISVGYVVTPQDQMEQALAFWTEEETK